jgi:PAS domain S-box-containing protein
LSSPAGRAGHAAPDAPLDPGPLFDLCADALVVQDVASGRIALWNIAAERLFGYTAAEAVGRPVAVLLPPAIARLHQERVAHFARTGEGDVLAGREALQIPAVQRGGDEIRVELTTSALELDHAWYILLTFRDGRLGKRAELQALELACAESALAESEERLASRERLLADGASEVEAALHQVRRAAERLRRLAAERDAIDASPAQAPSERDVPPGEPDVAPSERDVARRTRNAAPFERDVALTERSVALTERNLALTERDLALTERDAALTERNLARAARLVVARTVVAERVVRDVAEAAALDAGTFELELERINLVPYLSQLVAEARRRAPQHLINLGVPQGLTGTIDATRMQHVIESAIELAVRRNPRGCWIDVDLRRPLGGLARIEVRDYGRALSARERSALPGGGATSRQWSVLHGMVARHGGTLSVDAPASGGCQVVITVSTNGGRVTA